MSTAMAAIEARSCRAQRRAAPAGSSKGTLRAAQPEMPRRGQACQNGEGVSRVPAALRTPNGRRLTAMADLGSFRAPRLARRGRAASFAWRLAS
jgi:hypothetical protein